MKHLSAKLLPALTATLLCLACSGGGGKTLELKSEADLKGLTIACCSGNYYERKYSAREDVSVFGCNSDADAIQAVRQGLADVFVSDEVVLPPETQKSLGIIKAMRGDETFDVAFAVRKGNSELKSQLDAFIASAPVKDIIAHWVEGAPAVPDTIQAVISADAAPLRCITASNSEPVCYIGEGGEWIGMDADLLKRFAKYIGRPFEMTCHNLGSGIIALQTGQADVVCACLFATEERRKSVDFSDTYYKCRAGYFVLDKSHRSGSIGLKERIKSNLVTEKRWKLIVDGLLETLKITFFAILLGTVLGCGVCAAKRSRKKWLRTAAGIYSAFIAGIPTLVLLLIMFYVVFAGAGMNASLVAIITFALCFASSSGNIFDSAISSVPRGQTEAGLSLGFTSFRTFTGIVLPQALRKGIPLYASECVALLKNTSIVGYIAIQDITRASDLIRSRTFDAFIPLLIITVLYFVLAWIIRRLLTLFLKKK